MAKGDDEVRITLRMPSRLRDQLVTPNSFQSRSMNAEIVHRLEQSFGGQPAGAASNEVLLGEDGYCDVCVFSLIKSEETTLCRRYPVEHEKDRLDWCGEYRPREIE